MSVERSLLAFCYEIGLCGKGEACSIQTEYRQDFDPQVYILRNQKNKTAYRLRIQTDRVNAVKTEHRVCNLIKEHGISGFYPEPIGCYSEIAGVGDITVSTYIEGVSIDKIIDDLSLNECEKIAVKIEQLLNRLHSINDNTFHCFTGEQFPSWELFFACKLDAHLKRASKNGMLSGMDDANIRMTLTSDINLFKGKQSVLLHFDVKPANIVYRKETGKISFIDFEMSRFGDALYEFSKGTFAAEVFGSSKYMANVWAPVVEACLKQPMNEILELRLFIWYLFYHYLAYANYTNCKNGFAAKMALDKLRKLSEQITA